MINNFSNIIKFSLLTTVLSQPLSGNAGDLDIVVRTAPIVPHGLIAGEPFDVTLSFVDLDPAIPGIAMKKGGTARIILPKEIINSGFPVAKPGTMEGCMPPILARCSSGGMLDGWPQSPILPINLIDYDEASHALILTTLEDSVPYSVESPGLKLVHLFTFGFINPNTPGDYPIILELRPDPVQDTVLTGTAMLKISDKRQANAAIDTTQSIHLKGPRYQNTMFQTIKPGHTSRNMSSNLWNAEHKPIVGAHVVMSNGNTGELVSADGSAIGTLSIKAPADAKGFYLMSTPSFAAKTGLAGYPTGRLVTSLKTAAKATGTYAVTLSLNGGNETVHTIKVE